MIKEDIEFKVDGQCLRGRLYKPDDESKDLALLFLHGWTGKPNDKAAEVLADNGFYAMVFSLSGHNDSEGELENQTRQKTLEEIVAAYDLFKNKLPPGIRIASVGNSYGGYFAAVLCAERNLAAISMRVPANYRDEGFDQPQLGRGHDDPELMDWRQIKVGSLDTRSLRALHDFRGPVQIIEAEHDDAIPHQTVQNYVDAVKDKKQLEYRFMKDWPHSLGDHKARNKQFQRMLLNWVKKQTQ